MASFSSDDMKCFSPLVAYNCFMLKRSGILLLAFLMVSCSSLNLSPRGLFFRDGTTSAMVGVEEIVEEDALASLGLMPWEEIPQEPVEVEPIVEEPTEEAPEPIVEEEPVVEEPEQISEPIAEEPSDIFDGLTGDHIVALACCITFLLTLFTLCYIVTSRRRD